MARMTCGAAAMAAGLAVSAFGADCGPWDPGSPADVGMWSLAQNTPVFIGHAAHLPNGKMLLYSGEVEQGLPHISSVWDPRTNTWTTQDYIDDIFCAGQVSMPDGRVLVAGGSNNPGEGITATNIFDGATEQWTKIDGMEFPRWYPCLMNRPDGTQMVGSSRVDLQACKLEYSIVSPK